VPVRIAGIAKGSGMIAPDMATMLVYIFTDADHRGAGAAARHALAPDRRTFNAITVDSDTSTSDTLMVAATGQRRRPDHRPARSPRRAFEAALGERDARSRASGRARRRGRDQVRRDRVTGAQDDADARKVAMAIANSPLVKTAIAGEDPNWGRIVMAVGKSGAKRPTATG
jgi:glutamate N-acetyltransferase / amino-acid N-acetyltransferase